jgi:Mrp family chromosome partitioning ATPase/capsular polysaccharide biosynthesis protein
MTEERPHATFRDYALAFRRRIWVMLGIIVIGAAVGGVLAATSSKTYSAQAALNAQTPQQNAGLAELLTQNQQLPAETSAQLEQTATRPAVIDRVKQQLHLSDSIDQIRANISLSTDAQSNFVLINGTAGTADGAAALTNAVANAVVAVSNSETRAYYAGLAAQASKIATNLLGPFVGKNYSSLSSNQKLQFQTLEQQAAAQQQNAAHLATFAKVVTVAQVASPAGIPSSPSGPHLILNIIIGGALGLVLGLLAVWFLESLDRRLRRPDETAALIGLPVIGVVPKRGLGRAPGKDKDAASISAFRMLRTNVRYLGTDRSKAPHVILITSAMSEEGKTTVAMGLALASAASGLNTLLVEADVHRPVHGSRLGLDFAPGLADYLRGDVAPDRILQVSSFVDDPGEATGNGQPANGQPANGRTSKLTCITAGDVSGFSGDALGSQRFAEMISEVKQVYDLVVIDSAPLLAVAETSEMFSLVDAVVFCVRLGRTTTEQLKAARNALARLPEKLTGLVITDLPPHQGGYYGYGYADHYGYTASEMKRAKEPTAAA